MQDQMMKDVENITKELVVEEDKPSSAVALDTIDFYLGGDGDTGVVNMSEDVKFVPGTFTENFALAD